MSVKTKFISSESDHLGSVKTMVADNDRVWAAVAFWGAGVEEVFKPKPGCDVRIICNLHSGGCNPEVIKTLIDRFSKEAVKQLNNLHAKVVIGDSSALIGSANLSANGLGLEGTELTKWREASVLTSDPELYADTEKWFRELWAAAKSIEAEHLVEAQRRWQLRRFLGKQKRQVFEGFIADMPPEVLAVDEIQVIVWRDKVSDKSRKTFAKLKNQYSDMNVGRLDYYEDAVNLPTSGTFISVYYGAKGAIKIDGAFSRLAELDPKPTKTSSIQIVKKETTVLGRDFSPEEKQKLVLKIAPNIKKAWDRDEEEEGPGPVITLAEAIHGLKPAAR